MTAIGWIAGGLGLFIFGMWLLTESLKTLSGRGLRRSVHRWTAHPATALMWGALAGATTQSMSALTFVVISVLRSRLMTVESSLLAILGGGFGVTLIVVVATFDVRTPALCVLGVAAIVSVVERLSRYRALATALFGGALMILGLVLLKDGAAPVAEADWFRETMDGAGASLSLAFCIAALLTFVAQSSGAVLRRSDNLRHRPLLRGRRLHGPGPHDDLRQLRRIGGNPVCTLRGTGRALAPGRDVDDSLQPPGLPDRRALAAGRDPSRPSPG